MCRTLPEHCLFWWCFLFHHRWDENWTQEPWSSSKLLCRNSAWKTQLNCFFHFWRRFKHTNSCLFYPGLVIFLRSCTHSQALRGKFKNASKRRYSLIVKTYHHPFSAYTHLKKAASGRYKNTFQFSILITAIMYWKVLQTVHCCDVVDIIYRTLALIGRIDGVRMSIVQTVSYEFKLKMTYIFLFRTTDVQPLFWRPYLWFEVCDSYGRFLLYICSRTGGWFHPWCHYSNCNLTAVLFLFRSLWVTCHGIFTSESPESCAWWNLNGETLNKRTKIVFKVIRMRNAWFSN